MRQFTTVHATPAGIDELSRVSSGLLIAGRIAGLPVSNLRRLGGATMVEAPGNRNFRSDQTRNLMYLLAEESLITPDALNRLFEVTGAGLPTVASVRQTPLNGGYGYLSRLFRLELDWTGEAASDAPASLVAKLPLRARLDAMTPDAVRMYRREAMFHRVVANDAPLRTAKTWVAEFDEDTGAATMVFEDLSAMDSFGDNETVSVERVENALDQLASLHARYWQSDELAAMDWLAHPAVTGVDQVSAERFASLWPRMVTSGAYKLSSTQLRLGDLLSTKLDGVYDALHAGPQSLIHTDLHQENLFFDGNETTFIDWALAERANPAKDVAKLTSACLEPGALDSERSRLIKGYWKRLHGCGVTDGSLAGFERDVHLATCHYLASMSFLSDRDFHGLATNPETRTDFTTNRVIAACDDEQILATVEAL